MSDSELEEIINLIKPSVEEVRENEIRVEHCADRPDLFGIEGLARAIRSFIGMEKGLKKYFVEDWKISIKAENIKVRPFIAAAVIRNFNTSDYILQSLMSIQEVFHDTLGKKREKVAIGIHDLEKIKPPIKYCQVDKNEKMVPLGEKREMSLKEILENTSKGKEFKHLISKSNLFPVYIDSEGIFSFPPIINSERTKVSEKTRNLLIELTGIDKKLVMQTLNILVTNLAERKCSIEAVKIEYPNKTEITPELKEEVVELNPENANKILGIKLSKNEIISLLERMGYDSFTLNGKIKVIVPCYRIDILHEVDLIEDLAIAYGFNNFIPESPKIFTKGCFSPLEKLCSKAREIMIGLGFQETIRPVLTNKKKIFEKMNLEEERVIEIENFVSEEYTCLRNWLIPSLIEFLSHNKHVEYPQKIFEIGDVVVLDEKEEIMSKSIRKLAFATSHSKAGFSEVKSIASELIRNLGKEFSLKEFDLDSFIKGRCAKIILNGKDIGFLGEISPSVLEKWELEMPVGACEINLEELLVNPTC